MVSLCPLVSRLSLVARTGATAARILKGKTVPALLNRGVEANRVIETRAFTIKSYFDGGDDCGGAAVGNKENIASCIHDVSPLCPSEFELLNEDLDVIIDWSRAYKDDNSFRGGRHGKMIMLKVDSKIMEVPSGILPSSIKESDKEQMYKLHMEDPEVYTPEKLAKDYNIAAETVDEILSLRDALMNRYPEATERAERFIRLRGLRRISRLQGGWLIQLCSWNMLESTYYGPNLLLPKAKKFLGYPLLVR